MPNMAAGSLALFLSGCCFPGAARLQFQVQALPGFVLTLTPCVTSIKVGPTSTPPLDLYANVPPASLEPASSAKVHSRAATLPGVDITSLPPPCPREGDNRDIILRLPAEFAQAARQIELIFPWHGKKKHPTSSTRSEGFAHRCFHLLLAEIKVIS